jgi:hypothetical protein
VASARLGDYSAMTLRSRSAEALDQRQPQRQGVVKAFPRQTLHVWNLVADALRGMGYGRRRRAVVPRRKSTSWSMPERLVDTLDPVHRPAAART